MNKIKCVECGEEFWPSEADGWEKDTVSRWGKDRLKVEFAVCPECGEHNTHEKQEGTTEGLCPWI